MLILNEFIELREKLINNEIGIGFAKEQCWKDLKEGKRSWHDWCSNRIYRNHFNNTY